MAGVGVEGRSGGDGGGRSCLLTRPHSFRGTTFSCHSIHAALSFIRFASSSVVPLSNSKRGPSNFPADYRPIIPSPWVGGQEDVFFPFPFPVPSVHPAADPRGLPGRPPGVGPLVNPVAVGLLLRGGGVRDTTTASLSLRFLASPSGCSGSFDAMHTGGGDGT